MMTPINDLVLLEDISSSIEDKTKSGIIISAKGNPTPIYEVKAKGPKASDEFKIGDKVVIMKVTGQSISDKLYITRSSTILAVVEE